MKIFYLGLPKRIKERFIYSIFDVCNTCIVSFDLWMSRVDIFFLIVHFLNDKWEVCHVIVDFLKII